jgi:transposase
MRGRETKQSSMLCLMSPEERVPADHPLRRIKKTTDDVLKRLSPLFDEMYSVAGRSSVPPERLLKAMLLMALYSVRSERMFCEQLNYNLLFRWFLDMDMVEESFDPTTFSHNRARLLEHDVAKEFFSSVVGEAKRRDLMSADHFSVDGTLIEAWASMKSFRPKDEKDDDDKPDGNGWHDFSGKPRSNDTHESKTDPESKLARKGRGQSARLCFSGHALMEHRNGLLADFRIADANQREEVNVALTMLAESAARSKPITVAADRGYDTKRFVRDARALGAVPHVAQLRVRRSNVDGRTTRHPGYGLSLRFRMRIEEIFGWVKTTGNFRRSRWRGVAKTQLTAYMVGAAYNLLRMARLQAMEAS